MRSLTTTTLLTAWVLGACSGASTQTPQAAPVAPAPAAPPLAMEPQAFTFELHDEEQGQALTITATVAAPRGWTRETTGLKTRLEGPLKPGEKPWAAPYLTVELQCYGVCARAQIAAQLTREVNKELDYARESDREILEDQAIPGGAHGYAYRFPSGAVRFAVLRYQAGWPRALACGGGSLGDWRSLYDACVAAELTSAPR